MHSLLVEIKLLQTQLLVQLISEAISSLSTAQQDIPHKKTTSVATQRVNFIILNVCIWCRNMIHMDQCWYNSLKMGRYDYTECSLLAIIIQVHLYTEGHSKACLGTVGQFVAFCMRVCMCVCLCEIEEYSSFFRSLSLRRHGEQVHSTLQNKFWTVWSVPLTVKQFGALQRLHGSVYACVFACSHRVSMSISS